MSCLVHGIAGIGKTQIALEYAHRYRKNYDYIFWVQTETRPDMVNDMLKILATQNIVIPDNATFEFIAGTLQAWFTNTTGVYLGIPEL